MKLCNHFTGTYKKRNTVVFLLGCATGYRISELLSIRIKDVVNSSGEIVDYLTIEARYMKGRSEKRDDDGVIIQRSTKRSRTVQLNESTRRLLREWVGVLNGRGFFKGDNYLFPKWNRTKLDRVSYWCAVNKAKKAAGLTGKIATHSMRKTFGTTMYEFFMDMSESGKRVDVWEETAKMMDQVSIESTRKYIRFKSRYGTNAIEHLGELLPCPQI